jgi:hypothetical protein
VNCLAANSEVEAASKSASLKNRVFSFFSSPTTTEADSPSANQPPELELPASPVSDAPIVSLPAPLPLTLELSPSSDAMPVASEIAEANVEQQPAKPVASDNSAIANEDPNANPGKDSTSPSQPSEPVVEESPNPSEDLIEASASEEEDAHVEEEEFDVTEIPDELERKTEALDPDGTLNLFSLSFFLFVCLLAWIIVCI